MLGLQVAPEPCETPALYATIATSRPHRELMGEPWRFMKIGITGAAGFIGSYLSRRMLANRAGEVRVLLRRPVDHSTFDAAKVVCGNLCSPRECEEFAAGLDVIYHLAHTNSPVNSDRDRSEERRVGKECRCRWVPD